MLSETQRNLVWTKQYEAEVRSLYFADLASSYTAKKQRIVGLSFFLSSGAAASLWAQISPYVALGMSLAVAILAGYSMAVNLDKVALKMAELHASWNRLADDYERLWEHWYEDTAEDILEALKQRGREISEQGTTDAPYKPDVMKKWQEEVYSRYAPTAA